MGRSWSWRVGHLLYWVLTTSGAAAKLQHFPFIFSNLPVVLLQQNNWSWAQLGFSVATVHVMLCLKIFQISDTNARQRTTQLDITRWVLLHHIDTHTHILLLQWLLRHPASFFFGAWRRAWLNFLVAAVHITLQLATTCLCDLTPTQKQSTQLDVTEWLLLWQLHTTAAQLCQVLS